MYSLAIEQVREQQQQVDYFAKSTAFIHPRGNTIFSGDMPFTFVFLLLSPPPSQRRFAHRCRRSLTFSALYSRLPFVILDLPRLLSAPDEMNLSHLILLVSVLLTAEAQWFIKKNDRSKLMNYPNPGKRSIADELLSDSAVECSIPYSLLQSYEQRATWLVFCSYQTSVPDTNENVLELRLPSSSPASVHLPRKRSYVVPPYLRDDDISVQQYMKKLLWRTGASKY